MSIETLSDLLASVEGALSRSGDGDRRHDALIQIAAMALDVARREAFHKTIRDEMLRALFEGQLVNEGRLYIAASFDRRLVKVGHTRQKKVSSRIRQLRGVGEGAWRLLTSVPGTREQETALHKTLDPWRFDRREYYRRTPALMAHLRAYEGGMLAMVNGQESLSL